MADDRTWRRSSGGPVALAALAVAALAASLFATLIWPPRPLFLWNGSASSPVGFFAVLPAGRPKVGDIVIAWAPAAARRLAAERHYLPLSVPLVKRVAAAGGDRVCASGPDLLINGRRKAVRRRLDRSGRILPWWSGCRRLAPGELLLLSPHSPGAFDGRYFGTTARRQLIGRARLLWAKPAGGRRG